MTRKASWRRGRRAAAIALVLGGLGSSLAVHAQTDVARRLAVDGDVAVEISNLAGSVNVVGWDQEQLEVTGTLGRGVEDLELRQRGGRVEIEVEPRGAGGGAASHLEIRLPRTSRVRVGTVSAEVTAVGLADHLEVRTVSGQVLVDGDLETLEAATVSGDVEIRGRAREVVVETVSGTVRLAAAAREVEAETVSGRLELRDDEALRRGELGSVSGSIDFTGSLELGARLEASSHNGAISVALPRSVSARFEVSSFAGRIRNELGPPARRTSRFTRQQELSFSLGGGEAQVRLESFSGSISLLARQ